MFADIDEGRMLRRVGVVLGFALLMLLVAVNASTAEGVTTQSATLTLAKITVPAGGQDFPITAVGFQDVFSTSLRSPRDIDQDSSGNLYVVGFRAAKVEVYDSTGKIIDKWGSRGNGPEQLYGPEDLAIFDDGQKINVIVADTFNHRIQVFTNTGNHLRAMGSEGAGDGQLNQPQGVATATNGDIYVADTYNHRVQVFSSEGQYLRQWGSQGKAFGQFNYPSGIDLGMDGNVYVADSNNHRIQVFSPDGTFLRQWGTRGQKPGQFNFPVHVFVADDGTVLISDTYNQRIQKFTTAGRFLAMWGEQGTGNGQFERPNGIFVTDSGLTYIVDIDNDRVEIFQQQTVFLDDQEQAELPLPAATYDITEPAEGGWSLAGVTCAGANATPLPMGTQVTLGDDDQANCTFANENLSATGAATASKYHDLDQTGSYSTGDVPLSAWTFRLRDAQGGQVGNDSTTDVAGQVSFGDLIPGDYTICEVLLAGWFNSEPGDASQPIAGTGQEVCQPITVIAGQTADVAFGNVAAATLVVTKATQPAGAPGPFVFSSDVADLNGSLGDGEQLTADVWPGTYTVTESDPGDEFQLAEISCDNAASSGDTDERTATFVATPGERVTCTFTNTVAVGFLNVTVYEDADQSGDESSGDAPLVGWTVRARDAVGNQIGGDSLTNGDGRATFGPLPAGDYLACQDVPGGWINTDPGDAGQTVPGGQEICQAVVVAAGEESAARFGNFKLPLTFSLNMPIIMN